MEVGKEGREWEMERKEREGRKEPTERKGRRGKGKMRVKVRLDFFTNFFSISIFFLIFFRK
jgi:hypothetical protein